MKKLSEATGRLAERLEQTGRTMGEVAAALQETTAQLKVMTEALETTFAGVAKSVEAMGDRVSGALERALKEVAELQVKFNLGESVKDSVRDTLHVDWLTELVEGILRERLGDWLPGFLRKRE
ncbi:MAG: hypothetical protein Kow0069_06980 [Promethearchaeota archaeon]